MLVVVVAATVVVVAGARVVAVVGRVVDETLEVVVVDARGFVVVVVIPGMTWSAGDVQPTAAGATRPDSPASPAVKVIATKRDHRRTHRFNL
ncbi:MAG: hypothetical protein M3N98_07060 [Actinomycetota bacterium]|nr:hypothetical protein [Actinomycetota bacterium]